MSDPWHTLRRYTQARIAQGRAGAGLPTRALLEFQLAHAAARDAVLMPWEPDSLALDISHSGLQALILSSAAASREHYLQRPELGRHLSDDGRDKLIQAALVNPDVAIILSNGLSTTAVTRHGLGLLQAVTRSLATHALSFGPICLVPNGRVALSDEIGGLLRARLAIILLGERPGLSAADSLGAYLTYSPRPGRTDADRNCLSNIRPPEGLDYRTAAEKLAYLASEALRRGYSGVALKDESTLEPRLDEGHVGVLDSDA